MSAEAYDLLGDFAHEVPEAADAVLRWKRERAQEAIRRVIERDRKAALDAAWESSLKRDRGVRPLD
jgi:hypothetical protein